MVPVFRNIYLALAKDSNSSQPIVIRFCLFLKELNKSKGAGLRLNILSTYPSLRWFIITHYNCKVLTSAHPQFNGLIDHNRPCRKSLDSLSSLYDLSAFQLNSLDKDIDPDINFTSTRYAQNIVLHTALPSLLPANSCNQKLLFIEFQHHVLSEMNFRFTIIGVTETRICDRECSFNFVAELQGYCFESVPTPLSASGVGLFIDQNCKYRVLERVSNSCYQALWIELHLPNNKKSVCGVTYKQHNNAKSF